METVTLNDHTPNQTTSASVEPSYLSIDRIFQNPKNLVLLLLLLVFSFSFWLPCVQLAIKFDAICICKNNSNAYGSLAYLCHILLWGVVYWSRSQWLCTLQQTCWWSGTGRYRIFLEHLHSHWKPLVYRHFLEQSRCWREGKLSHLTWWYYSLICPQMAPFFIDHHRNNLDSQKVKRVKVKWYL